MSCASFSTNLFYRTIQRVMPEAFPTGFQEFNEVVNVALTLKVALQLNFIEFKADKCRLHRFQPAARFVAFNGVSDRSPYVVPFCIVL